MEETKKKIWVFGGANIDVLGVASDKLIDFDSNIGNIELRSGGVGRNIAEACVLLGEKVNLVTCFGGDHYGRLIKTDCEGLGINCQYSLVNPGYTNPIYMAIMDENHDMRIAMNDMRILETVHEEMFSEPLSHIDLDDIIVMDTNFGRDINAHIMTNSKAKIALDPVSIAKIDRIDNLLHHISIFKPNKYEAKAISGFDVTNKNESEKCLNWFLDQGVEEIVITAASDGVYLGTKDGLRHYRHRPLAISNATGGGDSFLGGYIVSRINGKSPEDSVAFAISAAVTTIETTGSRREVLNLENVESGISKLKLEVEEL